jgi:hypothetical protein
MSITIVKRAFPWRLVMGGALFFSLLHGPAEAYRPFITEDAGVACRGSLQFEASWDHMRWKSGDRRDTLLLVPVYGLTEDLELSVEIPYARHEPSGMESERGVSDINLVAKYLLLGEVPQDGGWPRGFLFTLKGTVKMNNGDREKGLGTGDRDYGLAAVASMFFEQLSLHAMAGYVSIGDKYNPEWRSIYLYGLAADYTFGKWDLCAEVTGNRNPVRTEQSLQVSCMAGFSYNPSKTLSFDASVRRGLERSLPRWNISIGMGIIFL